MRYADAREQIRAGDLVAAMVQAPKLEVRP